MHREAPITKNSQWSKMSPVMRVRNPAPEWQLRVMPVSQLPQWLISEQLCCTVVCVGQPLTRTCSCDSAFLPRGFLWITSAGAARNGWEWTPGGNPLSVGNVMGYLRAFHTIFVREPDELSLSCLPACRFIHVWLFATLWTVAYQALLSMGFSRQEYWSGLPCPPPGDLFPT